MIRFLVILFLSYLSTAGQIQILIPNSLWIDKPVTISDSLSIIKSGYKKIVVYERHAVEDIDGKPAYDTTLIGTWTISVDSSGMKCAWNGRSPNWDRVQVTSQKQKRHKLIQIIGKDDHKFKLTHYIDKNGVITHTTNKIMSPYETRYHFNKISYSYTNGLLTEALYFKSNYIPPTVPYTKYVFEYFK